MMADQLPNLILEDRMITYKNFRGLPDTFNPHGGRRNFAVILEVDEGERMIPDGWNIRFREPREEGDPAIATLKVNVKYGGKGRPPRVVMITSRNKTELDESLVGALDWADVVKADMELRAYHYDVGGRQGISAYLVALWITVNEDKLEAKYADIPVARELLEPEEPD